MLAWQLELHIHAPNKDVQPFSAQLQKHEILVFDSFDTTFKTQKWSELQIGSWSELSMINDHHIVSLAKSCALSSLTTIHLSETTAKVLLDHKLPVWFPSVHKNDHPALLLEPSHNATERPLFTLLLLHTITL